MAAKELGATQATIHTLSLRLSNALLNLPTPMPITIAKPIQDTLDTLLPSKPTKATDLVALNDTFLAENKSDPASVFAAWEVKITLDSKAKSDALIALTDAVKLEKANIQDAQAAIKLTRDWGADPSKVVEAAKARWPQATVFRVGRS